jgi:putative component of toxin-antitoxin plasmid stabilization module
MLPLIVFQIQELLLDNDTSPFGNWFQRLDPVSGVKVQVALARIEQGNLASIKWFEGIGEIKIHWGQGCASMWQRWKCTSSCFWVRGPKARKTRTSSRPFTDGSSSKNTNQAKETRHGVDQRFQTNGDGANSE